LLECKERASLTNMQKEYAIYPKDWCIHDKETAMRVYELLLQDYSFAIIISSVIQNMQGLEVNLILTLCMLIWV
jgi:hypothetical protein